MCTVAVWYCEQNVDNYYIQVLCVFLEFPKEVPMAKSFIQPQYWGIVKNLAMAQLPGWQPAAKVGRMSFKPTQIIITLSTNFKLNLGLV